MRRYALLIPSLFGLALMLSACGKPAETTSSTAGDTPAATGGSVASNTEAPKTEPSGEPLDLDAYNTAIEDAQKEMTDAQKEMQSIQMEAQSGTGDKAALMKKLGDLLKRMGTAAATSADKLTAINPPADLKTVHQDIIEGNRSIGPLMIKAGEGMGESSANASMQEMQAAGQKMQEQLMKHLDEAGYQIGADNKIKKKS